METLDSSRTMYSRFRRIREKVVPSRSSIFWASLWEGSMRGKKNPKGHYVTQPSARREGYLNQMLPRGISKNELLPRGVSKISCCREGYLNQPLPRGISKSAGSCCREGYLNQLAAAAERDIYISCCRAYRWRKNLVVKSKFRMVVKKKWTSNVTWR